MDAVDLALRLAGVRSRAASLPGPGQIRALEGAALAMPRETMTRAEIRVLAEEAIAHLYEVTANSRNRRRCSATTRPTRARHAHAR
jgi:hypothetical protein